MKKLFCIFITLVIILSFAGCKENKNKQETPTLETEATDVDIVKFASEGKIPEALYPVGYDVDKIEEELAESKEYTMEKDEGENYTTFMTIKEIDDSPENIKYVYETGHPENGIKFIVSFSKSYGFENDVDPNTLKKTLESKGLTVSVTSMPENLIQFVPASQNCDCFTCTVSGYSLNFIFDSNYLAATILYKKG